MIARSALTVSLLALMLIAGSALANVRPYQEVWSVEQQHWTPGFAPFRWVKMSNGDLTVWYGTRPMLPASLGEWTIYTYSDPVRGEMAAVKCRELPGRRIDIEWARALKLRGAERAA